MRSVFWFSALLPVLALAPACDDDDASASETAETTTDGTDTSGSPTSGSAEGPGTTSTVPTSGTSLGTTGTTTSTTDPTTDPTTGPTTDETDGSTDPTDPSDSSGGSTGEPDEPPPPTGAATLVPWLEAGSYEMWAAEAERHPSLGPHFDGVRTFVNATLLESLNAGGNDHPVGSSVVKELYGPGPEVGGWAVMVKVAAGSSVDNWYWYESFEGTTYADDTGVDGCGNCHTRGVDFVRTTLPL